ncbi:MAG TPA: ParA family protein [Candidatus Obscuribacterales bacterium]
MLRTRHVFEEMLAQESRQTPALPEVQGVETVSLVDEPLDRNDAEPISEIPQLLLELEPEPVADELPGAEPTSSVAPEPVHAALRPLVMGVISHKGGTGKTTTALELARSWAGDQRRILLVDADPVQAAAHLLGLEAAAVGEIHPCAQEDLYYVHWLPAGWPHPARLPEAFLRGWDLVVIDTPSLQNPLAIQLLPLCDALLMTLLMEPACMRVLEQGAILLERRLDPRRQRLLGVLVTRYQPELALQTSLYASLQREYVGILLPEVIPEDPCAWLELLDPEAAPSDHSTFRQAYSQLATRLYSQLQPLKERAGGQT